MRCLSFPFRLFLAHAFLFLSSCVCLWLCGCLFLLHSFVVFFFGVFVCWWYGCCCAVHFFCVCCCWHWVLRLTFSSGHLFLTLALPSFCHLFPSVVSHHSSKLFQFESFLFSFCVNSSSTALTISFIRFVLIDFYGFCYLLLFASLYFVFLHNFYPTSSCFSVLLKTGFYPYKFYF